MTGTVLILGASGLFGGACATAFESEGWTVRRYDRRTGDIAAAAQGADVIVNGLNPPAYHDWDRLIPEITADVITAAEASGATVVLPGNVYVYGKEPAPWHADTPHRPVARKGRIRAESEAAYRAAATRGVRTIVLHLGDFIAPDRPFSVMNVVYLRAVKSGKITSSGPGVVRAHAYMPDAGRAVVALAEMRGSLPAFADIPFPGHSFTAEELRQEVERQTGRRMRHAAFPWWMIRLAAPFWELGRELAEMRYLYETPHWLDGTAFSRLVPDFQATPFDEVVRRSLIGAGVSRPAPRERTLTA